MNHCWIFGSCALERSKVLELFKSIQDHNDENKKHETMVYDIFLFVME